MPASQEYVVHGYREIIYSRSKIPLSKAKTADMYNRNQHIFRRKKATETTGMDYLAVDGSFARMVSQQKNHGSATQGFACFHAAIL